MTPPLAGSMNMRYWPFIRLDAVGAALYISACFAVGFVFSGALAVVTRGYHAFGRVVGWGIVALSAVAAQLLWIVVYRRVVAPVNAELTRQARAGSVPTDARALQARWDSVIVARVLLMGFAVRLDLRPV